MLLHQVHQFIFYRVTMMDIVESSINLTWMFMECGRKREGPTQAQWERARRKNHQSVVLEGKQVAWNNRRLFQRRNFLHHWSSPGMAGMSSPHPRPHWQLTVRIGEKKKRLRHRILFGIRRRLQTATRASGETYGFIWCRSSFSPSTLPSIYPARSTIISASFTGHRNVLASHTKSNYHDAVCRRGDSGPLAIWLTGFVVPLLSSLTLSLAW